MPVHFRRDSEPEDLPSSLLNIGQGGVAISSHVALKPGDTCEMTFPLLGYPDTVHGKIVWCKPESIGYSAGVQFIEEHPYSHARLVVDVCHVEYYRRDQRQRLGRELDHSTAVQEWRIRHTAQA
jgi:hypothetical protein